MGYRCFPGAVQHRETAKMAEERNAEQGGGSRVGGQRGRRKGITLLLALATVFRGKLIRLSLLLAADSAVHIFQVRLLKNNDGARFHR